MGPPTNHQPPATGRKDIDMKYFENAKTLDELKADLDEKGVDELKTKNFILRWKEIISNRLDGKALKATLPDVYGQFCKASTSRRFTIA